MKQLPCLEYDGQTTSQLLDCKDTHRIDSLLCAFEWDIQAKARLSSESDLTYEERLVLALMALEREVNNGGYHQFFLNSSRRFVPIIVDCLRDVGCERTAALTERAIAALKIPIVTADAVDEVICEKNPKREAILDECSACYYKIEEIGERLFPFIETHQDRIQLIRGAQLAVKRPLLKRSNAAKLSTFLSFKKTDLSLENLLLLAREVAKEQDIPATAQDIEAAAVMNAFERCLRAGDLMAAERWATPAFEMMREDGMHSVVHRRWVSKLIEIGRLESADVTMLSYLEYLKTGDRSRISVQNNILFWAALLQKYRTLLPRSVQFFIPTFPDVNLDKELPRERFATFGS
jgi:hypothetical protein